MTDTDIAAEIKDCIKRYNEFVVKAAEHDIKVNLDFTEKVDGINVTNFLFEVKVYKTLQEEL